jgi:hypothetical protein
VSNKQDSEHAGCAESCGPTTPATDPVRDTGGTRRRPRHRARILSVYRLQPPGRLVHDKVQLSAATMGHGIAVGSSDCTDYRYAVDEPSVGRARGAKRLLSPWSVQVLQLLTCDARAHGQTHAFSNATQPLHFAFQARTEIRSVSSFVLREHSALVVLREHAALVNRGPGSRRPAPALAAATPAWARAMRMWEPLPPRGLPRRSRRRSGTPAELQRLPTASNGSKVRRARGLRRCARDGAAPHASTTPMFTTTPMLTTASVLTTAFTTSRPERRRNRRLTNRAHQCP